jgi:mobilization protein NikA
MHLNRANKKAVKVSVWCTQTEKKYIEIQAKKAGLPASEYLRALGMQGRLKKPPTLPPEVLSFKGCLAHLAGVLEPLTIRRQNGEDLSAIERAEMKVALAEIKKIMNGINNHLQ